LEGEETGGMEDEVDCVAGGVVADDAIIEANA
jgi:hypothetical protein